MKKNAARIKRYIGTLQKPGSPDEYIPHAGYSLDGAREFFTTLVAEKWPGWTVASVKLETAEHCVPKLDPIRWAEREAALAEVYR